MSKDANRAAFPYFSRVIDRVRQDMPGIKVLWVEEAGNRIGSEPPADDLVEISAERFMALDAFYRRAKLS